MTTNNPNDEAWTDSAPEEQSGKADTPFKVVSPTEGGSAAVTREEIDQQTAEMASREDAPSHVDYAAAMSHNPARDAAPDHDQAEGAEHEEDATQVTPSVEGERSEHGESEPDSAHDEGAGGFAAERDEDERVQTDGSHHDHSLGGHVVDDDHEDHSLNGAHAAEQQTAEDHSLGGHVVEDDHEDHSLNSTHAAEEHSSRDAESSPPLYRDVDSKASEDVDSSVGRAGRGDQTAGSGSTTGAASATTVAPAVVPVQPPPPDRAQQRAERDHALGKREKLEGEEPQAPAKPKPTTDKFFGSLGLFLLRLALAAVVGLYGLQKVRGIEGVQALLTSTALRDVVPENYMLLLAWVLAVGEIVIAAGLIFGFLTRGAGFGALLVGTGALVLVYWLSNPISLEPGAGFPGALELMIAVSGLLFLLLGAGRWSIDGAIRSRRAAKKAAQH